MGWMDGLRHVSIGSSWHGEPGGKLTRSRLPCALGLERIYDFFWMVLSWKWRKGGNLAFMNQVLNILGLTALRLHWLIPAEVVDSVLMSIWSFCCLFVCSVSKSPLLVILSFQEVGRKIHIFSAWWLFTCLHNQLYHKGFLIFLMLYHHGDHLLRKWLTEAFRTCTKY